jgi:hypothetical protein
MDKSDTIKELAGALAKAQAEMPAAPMNAVNPFLKNKYADLGSIIKTAAPVLAKHGLSYVQTVGGWDEAVSVSTVLMHTSGDFISDTVSMTIGEERGKSAAQVAGSIITYLRRYSLASMLGMYADEDVAGSEPLGKKVSQKAKPVPASQPNQDNPSYSTATINAVMQAGKYKAAKHVVAILALSKILPGDVTPETAVHWHNGYRTMRDDGMDKEHAAEQADKMIADILAAE